MKSFRFGRCHCFLSNNQTVALGIRFTCCFSSFHVPCLILCISTSVLVSVISYYISQVPEKNWMA